MKVDIHPKYSSTVEIKCSCGNVIVVGSTREKMKTELCSKCHPFYTGQQRLVDTAGRVDKFQAQRKKSLDSKAAEAARVEAKKKKPEVYKEKVVPAEIIEKSMAEGKPASKWGGPIGDSLSEEVVKEDIAEAKSEAEAVEVKMEAKAKKPVAKKTAVKKPAARKAKK